MMGEGGVLFVLCLCASFHYTASTCTYPNDLDGTWHLSDLGEVTFNGSSFTTKYSVMQYGTQKFDCSENNGNYYLSVSQSFRIYSMTLRIALCWDLSEQSSSKYIYYTASGLLENTTNARLIVKEESYVFSTSNDCSFSSTYHAALTRAMIKDGTIDSGKVICPDNLLGTFSYTYDAGSGNTCTGSSYLDVCTETSLMSFNYSLCATKQGYSLEGNLYCVHSADTGSGVFTIVYNADSVTPDESTYYRFTCYVTSQSVTSNGTIVYMTQYQQACQTGQTPTAVTTGASLVLNASTTCVPVVVTTETPNTLSAGSIAAVALVGGILLLAIAIMSSLWCYKKWKQKHITPAVIGTKSPPIDTFDRVESANGGREYMLSYSPYPTISEMATLRFGPSPIPDDDGGLTLATGDGDGTPRIVENYMDIDDDDYVDNPEVNPTQDGNENEDGLIQTPRNSGNDGVDNELKLDLNNEGVMSEATRSGGAPIALDIPTCEPIPEEH